jgi:hypothetical protein
MSASALSSLNATAADLAERGGFRWPARRPVAAPSRGLRLPHLPWTLMLTIAAVFLSLKALMIVRIGEHEYRAKLNSYPEPSLSEQVVLALLEPDRFSLRLHDFAQPYLVAQHCRDITKKPRVGDTRPLC